MTIEFVIDQTSRTRLEETTSSDSEWNHVKRSRSDKCLNGIPSQYPHAGKMFFLLVKMKIYPPTMDCGEGDD